MADSDNAYSSAIYDGIHMSDFTPWQIMSTCSIRSGDLDAEVAE